MIIKYMDRLISLMVFCFIGIGVSYGQNISSPMYGVESLPSPQLSIKGNYGFLWAHKQKMSNLISGHVSNFEIDYEFSMAKGFVWQEIFNHPKAGISFLYGGLGNAKELGIGTALYGFLRFPLITNQRFMFSYKWGSGLGVISKPFHSEKNYKNVAIGSTLNMFMHVSLEARFLLSNKLSLSTGLGYSHYSNGAFKMPNLGINIPDFRMGVSYQIGDAKEIKLPEYDSSLTARNWEYSFFGAYSLKEVYPAGGIKYQVCHFEGDIMKRVDEKRKIGLGFDVYHDASTLDEYNHDYPENKSDNGMEFVRYGIHFSHELVFGRFSAITQFGVYLHTKYKGDGPIYHRFAYRYYIDPHIFVDVGLKTHWGVAQNLAIGVGYKL